MTPLPVIQRDRRLWLMIALLLMGVAVGFVWGREYGYAQGKADTIRTIEQKLEESKRGRLPT